MSDERVCEQCGEANPARAKFCLECGTPLSVDLVDQLPQRATEAGERRVVTVLFADLSGFTSFSERSDVEDVRALAREAADGLGDIVLRYGGHVDKIIGDCVMAVWGAPAAHEDDPERAVRAALDMQEYAETTQGFAGLKLSIGLTTGEAMWAPVGGQHTVLGDTVNTAARLQGAAGKGEVYVGEPTYAATREAVSYEELEPIKAKNKREPVLAFKPLQIMREAPQRRTTTSIPLVGRETERARLWELWELVRTEGQPYSALILGNAGLGKSRLIQAVTNEIGAAGTILRGVCLPYGEGITYWPVIEMIRSAAGILHDDDHVETSRKLGALLEGLGSEDLDELRTMAVALANLVGEPTTPRGTYTATEISKGELHWGLRRILELAARTQPVVLWIEDLHWAEPALLELIDYIVQPKGGAPILGIGTARPEFVESNADFVSAKGNRRVLELSALDKQAAAELVVRLIGEGRVDAKGLQQLLDAAGGNPLFLEEIIQTWVDEGADPDALASMAMPSGLQALISSRLDGLPSRERHVLGHAAVVGDIFWSAALTALSDDNEQVEAVVSSLVERDLVHPRDGTTITGQREFAFKHGLIREVAYGRLPKTERAVLHERCGEWVAELGRDEFAEIIAYHLEEACKLAAELAKTEHPPPTLAAVNALTRAAEKAEGRQGAHEAARFYDRALAILGPAYAETSADLKGRRMRIQAVMGDLQGAYEGLAEAARAAHDVGRTDLEARALSNLAGLGLFTGHIDEARAYLDQAEEAARSANDPKLQIRAALVRAELHGAVDGDVADAERELKGAVELAEEIGDQLLVVGALNRLGMLVYGAGRLRDAANAFRRINEVARDRGSLQEEAHASGFLAEALYHLGPREESKRLARRADTWLERLNDRVQRSQAMRLQAKLALEEDEPEEAQSIVKKALEVVPPDALLITGLYRLLAEARARLGRVIGSRTAATAAETDSGEDRYASAFAAVASGCASAAEGSVDAVRERFQAALALFEELNRPLPLAESRITYARALTRFADHAEAKEQLQLAGDAFRSMDADGSAGHVESLLAKMNEGADLFGPLA